MTRVHPVAAGLVRRRALTLARRKLSRSAVQGTRRRVDSATSDAVWTAVRALSAGGMVIVTDDEDRENEGDLVLAAELATPEDLDFLVRYTSGIICVPMHGERLDALGLPQMVGDNEEVHATAFTVSVDHRTATTGVSALDRSRTIRALADPDAQPADFRRPGHVFPLRYREGGVLSRPGHTEASVDLLRLAGLSEVAVIGEIVGTGGRMARGAELDAFTETTTCPCSALLT